MTMLSHQRYDREDPDYRYIVGQVSEAGRPKTLDLSKINGGDWQVLCVIGSYKNAGQVLRDEAGRRQIELDSIDRDLVFLDDPESAVAFVDGSGRGRIILIGDFQHLTSQHTHQCFGPETREIVLPLR
jgi:hypothetical protein